MSHLTRLVDEMKKVNADAFIVTSNVGQRYLSDFDYTDGYILVMPEKSYLLTDFRYIEAAKMCKGTGEFELLMPEDGHLACMTDLLCSAGAKTILIEEDEIPFSLCERFKKQFTSCKLMAGGSKILGQLRIKKDAGEIEKIRRAQAITDAAFAHIVEVLNPDMTELDVALELEFFMRKMGSEGIAFETIAVSGTNSSRPHGVPCTEKLQRGFLTMDFGAKFDGYCSDMTRTVILGKADAEEKRLYETVLKAQTSAIEGLHEGMMCRDADKIARDIIDNAGYKGCFGHSLGHGVGMYIHEAPNFSSRAPETMLLERGHVVTVEPGIYVEGKYGCRIEDMIYCQEDGTVVDLTHSPKQLIELF